MVELELSLMIQNPEQLRDMEAQMVVFEEQSRIRVHITPMTWSAGWSEMVRSAIYGKGPHVSEVGTTWVADLVGMNALQPLPKLKVSGFGGTGGYLPQSWQSCFIVGDPKIWAVPWLAGARVLYYRRDWLEKAGIEPSTAFPTPEAMLSTLARLQASGITRPVTVTTQTSLNTLHLICSWVWGAGGEFVAENGKDIRFAEDKALDGMAAYFSLGQYLGPAAAELTDASASALFWGGQAAVTLDGLWVLPFYQRTAPPEVVANVGVALLPGPSYVGGSNLVVWKHTAREDAALDLVRFLTSPTAEMSAHRATGLLPARRDLLQSPEIASDFSQRFNAALESGRSWPNLPFGGMLEDKLTKVFGEIWQDIYASPAVEPREILRRNLLPLERRLTMTLSS